MAAKKSKDEENSRWENRMYSCSFTGSVDFLWLKEKQYNLLNECEFLITTQCVISNYYLTTTVRDIIPKGHVLVQG